MANHFDLTSISLPMPGMALPAGLMLFARHGVDRRLLHIAAAVERVLEDELGYLVRRARAASFVARKAELAEIVEIEPDLPYQKRGATRFVPFDIFTSLVSIGSC